MRQHSQRTQRDDLAGLRQELKHQFRQDDLSCRQFASEQASGETPNEASIYSGAGTAVLWTGLGAVLGAIFGAAAGPLSGQAAACWQED